MKNIFFAFYVAFLCACSGEQRGGLLFDPLDASQIVGEWERSNSDKWHYSFSGGGEMYYTVSDFGGEIVRKDFDFETKADTIFLLEKDGSGVRVWTARFNSPDNCDLKENGFEFNIVRKQ